MYVLLENNDEFGFIICSYYAKDVYVFYILISCMVLY